MPKPAIQVTDLGWGGEDGEIKSSVEFHSLNQQFSNNAKRKVRRFPLSLYTVFNSEI